MKKFLTMAAAAVMAVCLLALSACGGAKSTLSSFVNAVKKADFETAAEYVEGGSILYFNYGVTVDDEIDEYIYKQTAGSFKYSVDEEYTDEEDPTYTVLEVSYSCYSYTILRAKANSAYGEITKSDVDGWIEQMEKKEGSTTLYMVESDGGYLINAASSTKILAAMLS